MHKFGLRMNALSTWRWMPGMAWLRVDGRTLSVGRYTTHGTRPAGVMPHLDDPATLGLLLFQLVSARMSVTLMPDEWTIESPHGWRVVAGMCLLPEGIVRAFEHLAERQRLEAETMREVERIATEREAALHGGGDA